MALHEVVEQIIHRLRYRRAEACVVPCRVLVDLGCGRDYPFLRRVAGRAETCWGLDRTVLAAQDGRIRLQPHDLAEPLPFADEAVDQFLCLAVIEHLPEPRQVIRECARCLAPGGRLIVTTPSRLGIWVHEVLQALRLVRDVPAGEHQDHRLGPGRLADWVAEAGLIVRTARHFEAGLNVILVAEKPRLG